MTPDPANPVLYACIAWGSTVLAELSSGDPDIDALALRCLGKAPAFHLQYSHAVRKRIYAFLMVDPYVYFAIADEALGKTQCLLFLERLRDTFSSWSLNNCPNHGGGALTFRCFQDEFGPVFRRLLPPLLGKDHKGEMLKIKENEAIFDNKETSERKKVEEIRAVQEVGSKIGNSSPSVGTGDKVLAPEKWARQIRTIVPIYLVVCSLLFGIWWLSVCKGFQCLVP